MFHKFDIDVDDAKYREQLGEHQRAMPKIARRMMGKVMSATKRNVKQNLRGKVLQRRTGRMARTIKFKTRSDFSADFTVGSFKASMHEDGPVVILPKTSPTLIFQVDGEWKRSRMVVLPRRQFVKPAIDEYWSTTKGEQIMDEIFDEALKQIYGAEQ